MLDQYGFRPGHDTEQPIFQILDKTPSCLNKTDNFEYFLGIFLDLKAFDILLNKLKHYGFRGTTINTWFRNYLTNRKQCASVLRKQNLTQKCIKVTSRVCFCFFLFINDLPNATDFFSSLFADDTGLCMSDISQFDLIDRSNTELSKAAIWFKSNELTLNVKKST